MQNFGWAVYEGRAPYDRGRKLDPRGPYRGPIQVYSHGLGCSVTGGFVYRGKARKDLVGRYFYGDYCSGTVWSFKVVKGKLTVVPEGAVHDPVADLVRRGLARRALRGLAARL